MFCVIFCNSKATLWERKPYECGKTRVKQSSCIIIFFAQVFSACKSIWFWKKVVRLHNIIYTDIQLDKNFDFVYFKMCSNVKCKCKKRNIIDFATLLRLSYWTKTNANLNNFIKDRMWLQFAFTLCLILQSILDIRCIWYHCLVLS